MNSNKKESGSTCNGCDNIDRYNGRCAKYRCPLPVNIHLEFLRCVQCKEEWRCNDESKSTIRYAE